MAKNQQNKPNQRALDQARQQKAQQGAAADAQLDAQRKATADQKAAALNAEMQDKFGVHAADQGQGQQEDQGNGLDKIKDLKDRLTKKEKPDKPEDQKEEPEENQEENEETEGEETGEAETPEGPQEPSSGESDEGKEGEGETQGEEPSSEGDQGPLEGETPAEGEPAGLEGTEPTAGGTEATAGGTEGTAAGAAETTAATEGTAAAAGGVEAAAATAAEGEVAAGAVATSEIWFPILMIAIAVILLIIIVIIAIGIIGQYTQGGAGQSLKNPYNPNNADHQKVLADLEKMSKQGDPVLGTKKLEIPNKEMDFLKNGVKNSDGTEIRPDIRMMQALDYLAKKHDHIKVSHIIYPYISMPIPTIESKSTANKTIIANISAHKDGKAVDISEIDYIYTQCTGCCNHRCSTNIKNDYWKPDPSKKCAQLCSDGCVGKGGPVCAGNPAQCNGLTTTCSKAIPIQVSWQDDPTTNSAARGTNLTSFTNNIVSNLGLQPNVIYGKSFKDIVSNIGQGEFEQFYRLSPGSLNGGDLKTVLTEMGKQQFAEKLNLPYGSFEGSNTYSAVLDTGQAKLEELLNLPNESLNGSTFPQWALSSAKSRISKELGMSYSDIDTPTIFAEKLIGRGYSDSDLKALAQLIGADENILINYRNGDINQLRNYGYAILENALGTDRGGISGFYNSEIPTIGWPTSFQDRITEIENKYGLYEGEFRSLIDAISNRENLEQIVLNYGMNELSGILGFPVEDIRSWTLEQVNFANILSNNNMTLTDLASILQIPDTALGNIFGGLGTPPIINDGYLNIGSSYMASYFSLDPQILEKYAKGSLNYEQFLDQSNISLDEISKQYGVFDKAFYEQFLKGDINGAFQQYGVPYFQQVTGISTDDINKLINTNDLNILKNNEVFKAIAEAEGISINSMANMFVGKYSPSAITKFTSGLGLNSFIGQGVGALMSNCQGKFKDAARNKVHYTVRELLQYPQGTDSLILNRITQIITYNYERDVLPFENGTEKPTLDSVYSEGRLSNYGLFTMMDPDGKPYAPSVRNIHFAY